MQKHNKQTVSTSFSNQLGFSHLLVLVSVVVLVGIAGTAKLVISARQHKSAQSVTLISGQSAATAKSDSLKSQAAATATTTSGTQTTTSQSSTPKTTTPTPTATTPATSGSTSPAPTLLSTLTDLIANVQKGQQAQVTASNVTVPGPISNAQARPIVFTYNGQVYFAYTQTNKPNFTTSASQTASSMATVHATVSGPSLVYAHLDKAANLVDPNSALVGYSTGGN